MARRHDNRKKILLRLDPDQLADLLHLPEELLPLSVGVDQRTMSVEIVLDAPSAIRDVGRGMIPPLYTWEQIVARRYEEV